MTLQQAIHILEPERPYTQEGIKKAYRTQAKLWHPDNFRVYEQQIEAGRRFIQIKDAYDQLVKVDIDSLNNYSPEDVSGVLSRNRATEVPRGRGEHKIFKTPLFKEADNILSLFYLFAKWNWFGLPNLFNRAYALVDDYIKPHKNGFGPTIARFILFLIIILGSSAFAAVTIPLLAFVALLFAPLMWVYIKTVKASTLLFKKILGYLPAPNCGHIKGELVYLSLRSLLPLVLVVLSIIGINYIRLSYINLLLLSGYILFTLFINISVLYEWVSFYRVQYLRSKINNTNTL